MCSLTRTHVRLHPSHLQEKVGATAVAVVKTNNTTLTAGRGKKFKFGVWCMFWHACIECICPLWPSSHAPASACLSCMVRLLWHCQLLACIGQRRPAQASFARHACAVCAVWLWGSVLLCMANTVPVLLLLNEQQTPIMHGDVSSNGARCICQSLTSLAFAWQITL
jgi:hypothetical protein